MDLKAKHLLPILLGAVIGAGLGWAATSAIKALGLANVEGALGVHGAGYILGGIVGMGLAVVAIVVRSARDPDAGPASNFSQINGMGSTFIGRSEPGDEGSYVTTEWFTILWLPIFPVCRYRLIENEEARGLFSREYRILEKASPRAVDVARVYGIELIALLFVVGLAYVIFK